MVMLSLKLPRCLCTLPQHACGHLRGGIHVSPCCFFYVMSHLHPAQCSLLSAGWDAEFYGRCCAQRLGKSLGAGPGTALPPQRSRNSTKPPLELRIGTSHSQSCAGGGEIFAQLTYYSCTRMWPGYQHWWWRAGMTG